VSSDSDGILGSFHCSWSAESRKDNLKTIGNYSFRGGVEPVNP